MSEILSSIRDAVGTGDASEAEVDAEARRDAIDALADAMLKELTEADAADGGSAASASADEGGTTAGSDPWPALEEFLSTAFEVGLSEERPTPPRPKRMIAPRPRPGAASRPRADAGAGDARGGQSVVERAAADGAAPGEDVAEAGSVETPKTRVEVAARVGEGLPELRDRAFAIGGAGASEDAASADAADSVEAPSMVEGCGLSDEVADAAAVADALFGGATPGTAVEEAEPAVEEASPAPEGAALAPAGDEETGAEGAAEAATAVDPGEDVAEASSVAADAPAPELSRVPDPAMAPEPSERSDATPPAIEAEIVEATADGPFRMGGAERETVESFAPIDGAPVVAGQEAGAVGRPRPPSPSAPRTRGAPLNRKYRGIIDKIAAQIKALAMDRLERGEHSLNRPPPQPEIAEFLGLSSLDARRLAAPGASSGASRAGEGEGGSSNNTREGVLELTSSMRALDMTSAEAQAERDALLTEASQAAAMRAVEALADPNGAAARSIFETAKARDAIGDGDLDAIARETVKPMLAEWLNAHLPALVEQIVREELLRVRGAA